MNVFVLICKYQHKRAMHDPETNCLSLRGIPGYKLIEFLTQQNVFNPSKNSSSLLSWNDIKFGRGLCSFAVLFKINPKD